MCQLQPHAADTTPILLRPPLTHQLQSQLKLLPLLSSPFMHQLQSQLKLLLLLSPPLIHQLQSQLKLLPLLRPPLIHQLQIESAKTSPTLDSVVHNKAPVMTTPHTSGVGLAKTSPKQLASLTRSTVSIACGDIRSN